MTDRSVWWATGVVLLGMYVLWLMVEGLWP